MKAKTMICAGVAAVAMAWAAGCANVGYGAVSDADARLEAAAMERILSDPLTANAGVGVSVRDGTATVSGVVDGAMARVRVLSLVEDVDGIFDVRDRLQVR